MHIILLQIDKITAIGDEALSEQYLEVPYKMTLIIML
jgi:hypothetical protein